MTQSPPHRLPPSTRSMAMAAFAAPLLLSSPGRATPHRAPRRRRHVAVSASADVLVIGGGVIGLSTALELARSGRSVCVVSRSADESATQNAAGMLAATCEGLTSGPLAELARSSLRMYPDFVDTLECLSSTSVRYVSRNDFLVPYVAGESPPAGALDGDAARALEPALGPRVIGARAVGGDAHIDNRSVLHALQRACRKANVEMRQAGVERLQMAGTKVSCAVLDDGSSIAADSFVAASGAWTRRLLPHVPIRPVRGQMLAVRARDDLTLPLHVLHGRRIYIVPKQGGRLYYVGATVEEAGFQRHTTAAGIRQLLDAACEVVPAFESCAVDELWAGLRPAAPDLLPIIGGAGYQNLTLATGTYRNGMLIAPAVAKLVAAHVAAEVHALPPELRALADAFALDRFSKPGSAQASPSPAEAAQPNRPVHVEPPKSAELSNGVPRNQRGPPAEDVLPTHVLPLTRNASAAPSKPPAAASPQAAAASPKDIKSAAREALEVELTAAVTGVIPSPPASTQQAAASRSVADRAAPPPAAAPPPGDKAQVLLWEVNPDGTKTPVEPSQMFTARRQGPSPPSAESAPQTPATTYQGGAVPEGPGTSSDAYEDVMRHRANAAEKLSEGTAANRSFGRTPSSLERDGGGPALSLSAEEESAFDAAAQAAQREINAS